MLGSVTLWINPFNGQFHNYDTRIIVYDKYHAYSYVLNTFFMLSHATDGFSVWEIHVCTFRIINSEGEIQTTVTNLANCWRIIRICQISRYHRHWENVDFQTSQLLVELETFIKLSCVFLFIRMAMATLMSRSWMPCWRTSATRTKW